MLCSFAKKVNGRLKVMLKHLKVANYALIRELEVMPGDQFNVITGETGTGKSIIVGALGLIIGQRADTSMVNPQARKCMVEGTFHIRDYPLQAFFDKHELDYEEYTLLRREVTQSGKSRAFINDTPVTLSVLRELGSQLVDIHSQHQTLRLNSRSFQLSILDSYGRNDDLLNTYQEAYQQYRSLENQYDRLIQEERKARQDYDYYLFQVNEIEEADPQVGEKEQLEEELNMLANAEGIKSQLQQALQLMYHDEHAIQNQLGEVKGLLQDIATHSDKLQKLSQRLDSLEIELKDIAEEASDLEEETSVDNERLQILNQLMVKHGHQTIQDLLAYKDDLKQQLTSADTLQDQISETKAALDQQAERLHELGDQLSQQRHAVKDQVADQLQQNLAFVGIPEADVRFELAPFEGEYPFGPSGKDSIQLKFTANRGSTPQPVDQVASGGELSRLMLCLKTLLADTLFLPTIIFDEIDMGISGDIAVKVGQMIRNLARKHQVVSITHLPQVAAMGDHHFRVYKLTKEEETVSHMEALDQQARISEVAGMMAGDQVTETTFQNARELIHNNE